MLFSQKWSTAQAFPMFFYKYSNSFSSKSKKVIKLIV